VDFSLSERKENNMANETTQERQKAKFEKIQEGNKYVSNEEKRVAFQMQQAESIMRLNASTFRREVLQRLLNPGKDINYACGYPDSITINDYKAMYDREGLGTKVVSLMPDESWAKLPKIYETEDPSETEFEKMWQQLNKDMNIYHFLQRVDVLSGIGSFGVILLGLDDGKELIEPVEGIDVSTGEKVGDATHKLLYVRVFDESNITIRRVVNDIHSPRYGYPETYNIVFEDLASTETISQTKTVHWTRLIHVADNRDTSEIYGTPRMQHVYNRLLDVRKVVSGSGEMFWKGAFPGYSFEVTPGNEGATLDADSLRETFQNYANGLERYIAISGVTAKSLSPQVADPKGHIEAQMKYIAVSLGAPYRVFVGTEESRLAADQDTKRWNMRIKKRQEGYLTPMVIRVFVDRLIMFGILPEPAEYFVEWPDLNVPGEKETAEIAKTLSEAMAKYVGGGVDTLIPPLEYLTMILGMELEEAKQIEEAAMRLQKEQDEEREAELKARESDVAIKSDAIKKSESARLAAEVLGQE